MPAMDSSAPFLYIIIAALALLLLLQLWQLARRFRGDERARSKGYTVHLVDEIPAQTTTERQWLWDVLTAREMEVARLVALGKRNAEVARELSISIHTVETHIKHIYDKLDVHSRAELTRLLRDLVD